AVLSYLFFFSSRRRHTRFSRDWSSDVCSSDLTYVRFHVRYSVLVGMICLKDRDDGAPVLVDDEVTHLGTGDHFSEFLKRRIVERSEERRVGKECGSRWSRAPYTEEMSRAKRE